MASEPMAIEQEIKDLTSQIEAVEKKISDAEEQVLTSEGNLQQYWMRKEDHLREEKKQLREIKKRKEEQLLEEKQLRSNLQQYWMRKEEQLRRKEEQLRRKEEQLREEKKQLQKKEIEEEKREVKRQRREEKRQRREEALAEGAERIQRELVTCFEHVDVTALGDASRTENLRWPSVRSLMGTSGDYYFYTGRVRFSEIYETVTRQPRQSEVLFTGLPGSGKTTLAATVAGYLLVHRAENCRVVYVVGHSYATEPVQVLKEALILAYVDDHSTRAHVSEMTSEEEIVTFCRRVKERLIFVVDEWNELDPERKSHPVSPQLFERREKLVSASSFHVLVKVCSPTAQDVRQYWRSDKRPPCIELNDPFTEDELKTWLAATKFQGLKHDSLLEYYTGYRPWLLKFYAESASLADLEKRFSPYISSMIKYVSSLEDVTELERAMRMTVGAMISVVDIQHIQWDWSYFVVSQDAIRVRCASAYFSSILAAAIHERSRSLKRCNDSEERKVWAAKVEQDANTATAVNSARIGWNVEALLISVCKTTKVLLGQTFAKWKNYEHDGELAALQETTVVELRDGVLYIPARFNETAVDLVLVKLVKGSDGDYRLQVHGFQISVSTLKRKLAKDSHSRWNQDIANKWLASVPQAKGYDVKYTYILPESCPEELKEGVTIARFGQIDEVLEFVDRLKLPEPLKMDVPARVVCSGRVGSRQCLNSKRTEDKEYFCCEAHKNNVWSPIQKPSLC